MNPLLYQMKWMEFSKPHFSLFGRQRLKGSDAQSFQTKSCRFKERCWILFDIPLGIEYSAMSTECIPARSILELVPPASHDWQLLLTMWPKVGRNLPWLVWPVLMSPVIMGTNVENSIQNKAYGILINRHRSLCQHKRHHSMSWHWKFVLSVLEDLVSISFLNVWEHFTLEGDISQRWQRISEQHRSSSIAKGKQMGRCVDFKLHLVAEAPDQDQAPSFEQISSDSGGFGPKVPRFHLLDVASTNRDIQSTRDETITIWNWTDTHMTD